MRRHATVAAALLLFGCDKKDDGPGVSLETAPLEIARAVCPKAYNCCTPTQLMGNDLAGKDEGSCENKTAEGFKHNLDGLKGSIAKRRVRYHGDQMAACLAMIRAASCEQLNRTNHFTGIGCPEYVEALVSPGGACGSDVECIQGTCDKSGGGSEGVCKPLPQKGESCAGVRCARGLVCNGSVNQCEPEIPERAMCVAGGQCGSGTCAGPDGGPGSCAPPASDRCFYASACSYGRGRLPGGVLLATVALAALMLRRRGAGVVDVICPDEVARPPAPRPGRLRGRAAAGTDPHR
jgi:hypothetical protein